MRSIMKTVAVIIIVVATDLSAQDLRDRGEGQPGQSLDAAVRFFAPLFLPKTFQDLTRLKEFVTGSDFLRYRRANGDRAAVDTLYRRALRLSWDNTAEALWISLMATMEHRWVDVRIPLIGLIIPFPLTSEFGDEFAARVKALPSKLYDDSPRTPFGDKDKLQHFFGSAFLAYVMESGNAVDRLGELIEWGESRFVPGEEEDLRDMRANRQGQEFARALLAGLAVKPSDFMTTTAVQAGRLNEHQRTSRER